ncbi:hypothetical protein ACFWU3_30850 [Streptomyces sp. NPDC058685]
MAEPLAAALEHRNTRADHHARGEQEREEPGRISRDAAATTRSP